LIILVLKEQLGFDVTASSTASTIASSTDSTLPHSLITTGKGF
jgi:hypothetical protein